MHRENGFDAGRDGGFGQFRVDAPTLGQDVNEDGLGPRWTIGAAEAIQLVSAMMTSSPGPIPSAAMPMCSAPVQLDVAIACLMPRCSLYEFSNLPMYA